MRTPDPIAAASVDPAEIVAEPVAPVEGSPAPSERQPRPLGHELIVAKAVSLDVGTRSVSLACEGRTWAAHLDEAVAVEVVRTAIARGEWVLTRRVGPRWVVLGALRAAATPGVDAMDDVVIRGRRIQLEGQYEVVVRSGAASLVVRAIGAIESVALDITARAAGLHKIVGRMIRLN